MYDVYLGFARKVRDPGVPSSILANPKYTSFIYSTEASIAIVGNDFVADQEVKPTLIRVEDAYKSFSKLLEYYNQVKLNKSGIEQPCFISDTASYGEGLYLGAFSYLGDNVSIGDNVKIYPNVYIGDNVTIGDNFVFDSPFSFGVKPNPSAPTMAPLCI
jgi:UDP-3-O-[3-hydroxymyristoyl] glucosamine N-acyltransferase